MAYQTITEMFLQTTSTYADKYLYFASRDGHWEGLRGKDIRTTVEDLSFGLLSLGVTKGTQAAILSNNSPRWAMADYGILCAGVILAIMIIPYIAAVMRDVFEQTPVMMKESAYGIGCTTWEVIWRIVLPFTKNGVIGGIMLGLGRALGETMAVTFIIGNTYQLDSASLYMPGNSITSALANEFAEAESGLHVAALMELGLILFVITFIVLAISKLMIMRLAKNEGAR